MNSRERVLAALESRPADGLAAMPITMMFAADHLGVRYLEYGTDYRVLAEAQASVARAYDLDYVSVISDPAVEAADCGAAVIFQPDQPPAIDEPHALLADKSKLANLSIPDPTTGRRMANRIEGVRLLRERVRQDKIVEGWIEGPAAEAADLRGINTLMMDYYDDPGFVRDLFTFVVEMELRFARAQVEAGADLIGIGDAAASLVSATHYDEFIWPFEKRLIDGVHALGARVRLHICGNTRHILAGMGRLGCEIVDLDFLVPMAEAREKMGPQQVLLGNLDPVRELRNGTPESILLAVAGCHRQAGSRFIVGAGCEVPRDTPPVNLRAMVEYARAPVSA